MLMPSTMISLSSEGEWYPVSKTDDIEWWVNQFVAYPDDFVTHRLPDGTYVTAEVDENGHVIPFMVWVTFGWPQMSGCPDTW